MRKDTKMDAHVTRSGYRYYTPTKTKSEVTKPEEPGKPNPQPSLPNTGTEASMLPTWGMILGLLSLAGAGLRKHKK